MLLAGGLKPSSLTVASKVSALDLFVAPETSLLDHWVRCLGPLLDGRAGGGVRVIHCDGTPTPRPPAMAGGIRTDIQRDLQPFRGPAGVARDVCADLPGEAQVLIAEAARYLGADAAPFAEDHARSGADITLAVNPDGSPAGLYIAKRSTLEIVPQRGFMDLKEQWLSRAVSRGLAVRVFTLAKPGATPLRTRAQFLRACFSPRREHAASPWLTQGFTRGVLVRGRVSNVIAGGAKIDPGALLAHTIVMPGAEVAAGAVVARSILCPGARVAAGQEIIDAVVTEGGVHSDTEGPTRGPKERAR